MSKLGYIQNSYGKQFNIGISNTYATNILSGTNLPGNMLIISSPIDEDNNDIGYYSILVTDSYGNPIRLTYTISQNNGLQYSKDKDSLILNIDNNTIIENNHQLTANISYLIDNNTIKYENNKIDINIDNLNKANDYKRGLFKIDDNTIKSDNGKLYVDTSNLKFVNENTSYGICLGDNNTIISNQGILSVNTNNLTIANENQFGIVNGLSDNINVNDGVISVITDNLETCTKDRSGIVSIDNSTIILDDKKQLTINTENLNKVSVNNRGVFKYDDNVFDIIDGKLTVKNVKNIKENLNKIKTDISLLKEKISEIRDDLKTYKVGILQPMILDFHCCDITTFVLEKPNYLNEQINDMEFQYKSVDFIISTNCPFIISVKFENNIDPQVSLYEINYDNKHVYYGTNGLIQIYQTTQEKKIPIKFTFIAKNYYKNNQKESTNEVKVKITVSYLNDSTINKSILYSIVRFNSGYNTEIVYDESNVDKLI